jgi:hypothetical protein
MGERRDVMTFGVEMIGIGSVAAVAAISLATGLQIFRDGIHWLRTQVAARPLHPPN